MADREKGFYHQHYIAPIIVGVVVAVVGAGVAALPSLISSLGRGESGKDSPAAPAQAEVAVAFHDEKRKESPTGERAGTKVNGDQTKQIEPDTKKSEHSTKVNGGNLAKQMEQQVEAGKSNKEQLEQLFGPGTIEAVVTNDPKVVKQDTSTATVRVEITFQASQQVYRRVAVELQHALSRIAKEKGEFSVNLRFDRDTGLHMGRVYCDTFWQPYMPTAFEGDRPTGLDRRLPKKGCVIVAVATQVAQLHDGSEWSYYVLDESLRDVFLKSAAALCKAKLSLLGGLPHEWWTPS